MEMVMSTGVCMSRFTATRRYRPRPLWGIMLVIIGIALIGVGISMVITGCSATEVSGWLSEAEQLMPMFVTSAGSILAGIGAISGSPAITGIVATLNGIATDIENGIKSIQTMVAAYEANPGSASAHAI